MPADSTSSAVSGQIARRCDEPVSSVVQAASARLAADFGGSAEAVLAYGSCIRDTDPANGLLDLYIIVSDYRAAYTSAWLRWANRLLPPNVFYAALKVEGKTVRVKYAVVSLDDFERGIRRAITPYLWGRFAQPVRLVQSRDSVSRQRVLAALEAAVVRLLDSTHPLFSGPVTAEALWTRALSLSYGTELRPEPLERTQTIVARDVAYYRCVTDAAVANGRLALMSDADGSTYRSEAGRRAYWSARLSWSGRRWLGRVAALARLLKASLTFRGGVDYAAWKIERHTGTAVPVTPRLRRYPWLFGWGVLWQLLRRRLLR